jgi:hypothetical protein
MKKLLLILSLAVVITVFFLGCTTIDKHYVGKRIQTEPAEHPGSYYIDPYDYAGYYYSPYYSSYYDPFFWVGCSFWNPFWHYGYLNSWYYGYYSPYYYGYYSPYYWGYYSPYWGSNYYPSSRSYRSYITKRQLSGRSTYRSSPTIRRGTTVRKGYTTSIRSRSSVSPTRSSGIRTRTSSSSSRTSVRKRK